MVMLALSPLDVECTAGGKPRYSRTVQAHRWLRRRGTIGLTTSEVRAAGWANPSQVFGDLVREGVALSTLPEQGAQARIARVWLASHAPAEATSIRAAVSHTKAAPTAPKSRVVPPPSLSIFSVPGVGGHPNHETETRRAA